MQPIFDKRSEAQSIWPSHPSSNNEQIAGDDLNLDPRFFEESWTLGKSSALVNLRRRREPQLELQSQNRAAFQIETLATQMAERNANLDVSAGASQTWGMAHAAAAYGRPLSSDSWTPQDWVPFDRVKQRWIPEGWVPEEFRSHRDAHERQAQHCPGSVAEAPQRSMSVSRAAEILGVAPNSTRRQIRSEYRRKVAERHPDHLQAACEAQYSRATEAMTEINQAYHLLCATVQQAA